jgi:hypothetical protein
MLLLLITREISIDAEADNAQDESSVPVVVVALMNATRADDEYTVVSPSKRHLGPRGSWGCRRQDIQGSAWDWNSGDTSALERPEGITSS